MDAWRRQVSVWLLGAGTIVALFCGGYLLRAQIASWEGLFWGTVPGFLLLLLAALTKSTGAGDGIVLLQMNLLLRMDKVVFAFGLSLMIMGAFSAVLLLAKKAGKDVRIPYLPFLWLGCMGEFVYCG